MEVFETKREFDKKFPGKIYICFYCKTFTTNPHVCSCCGKQANILFPDKGYRYIIKEESNQTITIFTPIEIYGGKNNV